MILDAVFEKGQHAILFGERGVGKTSLANITYEVLPNDIVISKVTCNRTENFKSIWEKALRKVEFYSSHQGVGYLAKQVKEVLQLNLFLPQSDNIDSTDIQNILDNLQSPLLFIFDEFDSIDDEDTKLRFADTIKSLSDNSTHVTILIVGIADSIIDLIGSHPSIERCLLQIRLPRMSKEELLEIINNGFEKLSITIPESLKKNIIEFSSGFPHYTHLLCKYTAESCIRDERDIADKDDFEYAIIKGISNTNHQIIDSFQKATISSKEETQFENVIYACALAKTDEYDCFKVSEILSEYNKIICRTVIREQISYNLGMLCKSDRGLILEKIGKSKNIKYRFKNPMMKAYAKLKYHHKSIKN